MRTVFGSIIWLITGALAWLGTIQIGLIEQLVLMAPLVIIPLGLSLVKTPDRIIAQRLFNVIKIIQPFGATAVVIAFLLPAGLLAGVLAMSWLGITGLMTLLGADRFIRRGYFDAGEIGIDIGLVYISVGGGWLVLSRLGANPLGFGDTIVLLTAVHFHYTGFAAPIFAGIIGRFLTSAPIILQRVHPISVFGLIVGMPLVAAGITFSPLLEVIGAIIIATSLAMLVPSIGFIILRVIDYRLAQILLTVSALCLIIGMFLIYVYAIGEFTGSYLVNIPQMVRFHGTANAFGFAFCGLLAWALSCC